MLATGSVCAVSTVGQLAFPPLEGEYSISRGTPGDQTHSRIGLRPGGGTIVWQDNATDGDGLGISARALNNNFSPIASRTYRINQLGEGDQENPDIAILPDGGAAYVWQGGVEGQQDIWLRLQDSDGIFLSSEETRVNLYQAGMQQDPVFMLSVLCISKKRLIKTLPLGCKQMNLITPGVCPTDQQSIPGRTQRSC